MFDSAAALPSLQATLNLLNTPVWIVAASDNELVFANRAAIRLSAAPDLRELRHGSYSAHAEEELTAYLPALRARESIAEVWTVFRNGTATPLSCQLSLLDRETPKGLILVEGVLSSLPSPHRADGPGEHDLHEQLFQLNGAPMLLIDPAADGRIVDANQAACRLYGYARESFCRKHTWEINTLGREVVPIMNEVAKLPGGHKPLNFVHRMADGSLRSVQTYASPLELDGKRFMLCVIHDVTEQKRLKNELADAASRDPLTGLWNRRHFLEQLEFARQRKRRHEVDYSLMILDADNFKNVNDQFGHEAGDAVLVLLATVLSQRVRGSDSVCRWGGEEFIVLLPQTDLENALSLADSLRASIAELHRPPLPRITVSIGVAQHHQEEGTESLLRRADAALYQAKAAGRNCVVAG